MELELNWIKSDIELKYNTYLQDSCVCTSVRNKTIKQHYKPRTVYSYILEIKNKKRRKVIENRVIEQYAVYSIQYNIIHAA